MEPIKSTFTSEKPYLTVGVLGPKGVGKTQILASLLLPNQGKDSHRYDRLRKVGQAPSPKEEKYRNLESTSYRFQTPNNTIMLLSDMCELKVSSKHFLSRIWLCDTAIFVYNAQVKDKSNTDYWTELQFQLLALSMAKLQYLVVCINKMDLESYDQLVYEQVLKGLKKALFKSNLDTESIVFIPTCAKTGENIATPSQNIKWYKGPTLIQYLDGLKEPARITKPSRLVVYKTYKIGGVGVVAQVKVVSGSMDPSNLLRCPGSKKLESFKPTSFEIFGETLPYWKAGRCIGMSIPDIDIKDIKRGDVFGDPADPTLRLVSEIYAEVFLIETTHTKIKVKSNLYVHYHAGSVSCVVTQVIKSQSAQVKDRLEKKQKGILVMKLSRPIFCESFVDCKPLSRILIRANKEFCGFGIIKQVVRTG